MRRHRFLFLAAILVAVLSSSGLLHTQPVYAEEPRAEFLQALRDNGYEDMSIAYLEQLAARDDLETSDRETLDLEISTSYFIWSLRAGDRQFAKQYRDLAQTHFDRFASLHPKHSAIAQARVDWGVALLQHVTRRLNATPDLVGRLSVEQLGQFEIGLKEAETHFQQAMNEFEDHRSKEQSTEPTESEIGKVQSMLRLSTCRYYLASMEVNSEAQRQEYLKQASSMLETISRKYHRYEIGIESQLWLAKVLEKLGDDAAIDVYDEVLASEPEDPKKVPAHLAALYAEATLSRLTLMRLTTDPAVVFKEAEDWMKNHQLLRDHDLFRGIALAAGEIELELSEKAQKPALKAKLQKGAEAKIFSVAGVPGKYQQAAIRLRQQELAAGRMKTALTYEEQLAIAQSAARNLQWEEAIKLLKALFDQPDIKKNERRSTDLQALLVSYQYRLANQHFAENDWEAAITEAGAIARGDHTDPHATLAADLAARAALKLFIAADEAAKPAGLERLRTIVEFSSRTWPEDDVVMNGQLLLVEALLSQGEIDEAIKALGEFTRKDHVAPAVSMSAGRLYYRLYIGQRNADPLQKENARLNLLRQEADRVFQLAINDLPPGDPLQPEGRLASEARLLRAELMLDCDQPQAALECLDSLYKKISMTASPNPDPLLIRIVTTTLRAQIALSDFEHAAETAHMLIQMDVDRVPSNSALVQLAQVLAQNIELREKGRKNDAPAVMSSEVHRDVDLLRLLMKHLASRSDLTAIQMIFVSEKCASLQLWEPALAVSDKFLDRSGKDPNFRSGINSGDSRIRLVRARALRDKGEIAEAVQEIQVVVQSHPDRMDVLVEQLRITEQLAKTKPENFQTCVEQGTKLRKLLGRVQPRPPEYYEVILTTARCLLMQSQQNKESQKLKQAEQLLKATMTLAPHLSGLEMQSQYQKLLQKIDAAQSGMR